MRRCPSPPSQKKKIAASLTALRLDEWGLRRGEDVLNESKRLQNTLSSVEGWEQQARAVADFHGAAFEVDPQLNEGCTDKLRWDFLKQMLETPECQELRTATVLNDTASEIAATAFAGQYVALRQEHDKEDEGGFRQEDRHGTRLRCRDRCLEARQQGADRSSEGS